jgi:hypothetical protein
MAISKHKQRFDMHSATLKQPMHSFFALSIFSGSQSIAIWTNQQLKCFIDILLPRACKQLFKSMPE